MADIMDPAPAPATDKPAAETNVTEKAGSGSLLTGQTPEAATPEPDKGAPPADKAASPQPAQGNEKPGPVELAGFAQAATKELKGDQKFLALASKFKSFDEMARAHMELESRLGTAIVPPGENATPEERAAYWAKLGVPEAPDKYVLDRPELPDGLEYDDAATQEFQKLAHEHHISAEAAKALFAWQVNRTIEAQKAAMAQAQEAEAIAAADAKRARDEVVTSLKKEWGSGFQTELGSALRTVDTFESRFPGLKAELDRTGFGNSAVGIKLFHSLATMMADHAFVEGEKTPLGDASAAAMYGKSMKNP